MAKIGHFWSVYSPLTYEFLMKTTQYVKQIGVLSNQNKFYEFFDKIEDVPDILILTLYIYINQCVRHFLNLLQKLVLDT